MIRRLLALAVLGAIATGVAGCASKVPIRARGPSGGVQGGAWELVVPGPDIVAALAAGDSSEHPAHLTRRDHALGGTTPSWAPVAATAAAPATIERLRTIHLRRSHDSFLFFTAPQSAWPTGRPWWGEPSRHAQPPRYWEP